jgi:hypothetical protein
LVAHLGVESLEELVKVVDMVLAFFSQLCFCGSVFSPEIRVRTLLGFAFVDRVSQREERLDS